MRSSISLAVNSKLKKMQTEVILVLALGIFAGFFVQTAIGFAGALIALPILLFSIQLPDAVAYISIFYLYSSVFLIAKEWNNIDRNMLFRLALTSIVGVVLGILVLANSKPLILKKFLGIFILLYVAYGILGKRKLQLKKGGVIGLGVLAGFFSGVFSTGGPLYVMCIENQTNSIKSIRATMIGVLGLVTLTRIPALAIGGILTFNHLKMTLIVFPVFLLAQFLGKQAFKKTNEPLYEKSILLLLLVSGLTLLF